MSPPPPSVTKEGTGEKARDWSADHGRGGRVARGRWAVVGGTGPTHRLPTVSGPALRYADTGHGDGGVGMYGAWRVPLPVHQWDQDRRRPVRLGHLAAVGGEASAVRPVATRLRDQRHAAGTPSVPLPDG